MGMRKNYQSLDEVERSRFVQALHQAKSRGIVDRFASIHASHFGHLIHRSSHFLPWHREMLLRFEGELQAYHPAVTIPYWDSTTDQSPADPLWANDYLGQFNSAWWLWRSLGGSGTLPTAQQVEANQAQATYGTFWAELEDIVHNPPHGWVGGVMAGTSSPGDPAFYLHHCWIDMLWARWQRAHPPPSTPFVASRAGAGLNDPLMEWPDRTPAHVLDPRALGYCYDTVRPAVPTVPTAQGNDMQPGELLTPDSSLRSANGLFLFVYQWDGNLVLYGPRGYMWDSSTDGRAPGVCIMQGDGNLVVYGPCWDYIWDTSTHDNPGCRLVVQDDGNVVIYRPNGTPAWETNTPQVPPETTVVPDVIGLDRMAASNAVSEAGLVPTLSGHTSIRAWVYEQSPTGGTVVDRGSDVDLSLRGGLRR